MTVDMLIAIISSAALFSFIEFMITRHDKGKKETVKDQIAVELNPIAEGVKMLLQDKLDFFISNALERGYTTKFELKKIRNFLGSYEGLKGDDYIHDLFEEYKELPIKE